MNPLLLAVTDSELAEKTTRAVGGLFGFAIGLLVLLVVVAWIVFPLLMSSRISEVLAELKHQTKLLEQVVKNTTPPPDPAKKPVTPSHDYIREDNKMSAGWVLALVVLAAVILFVVVMANK